MRDGLVRGRKAVVMAGLGLGLGAVVAAAGWMTAAEVLASEDVAVTGRVVDANTGEPIEGAWVFEVVPGEWLAADVRRFERVREQQTDADGRFRFEPVPRSWWDRFFSSPSRPPRYHTYHPSYGLVYGRETAGTIRLSLRDSALRQQDARALCTSRLDDAFRARIRSLACPPARPDLFPNGEPRARGDFDQKGRRSGPWQFYREDGSVIAVGMYVAGGAVGGWRYFPKPNGGDD